MAPVDPVPKGMHTITPSLVLRECAKAMEFYVRALGALEISRVPSPDGKSIWHAAMRVGDSTLFLADQSPMSRPAPSAASPVPVTMWLYVPDCDASFQRAVKAGAKEMAPPSDMFWGDRCAGVADPYGYRWSFATRRRDLTPEEVRRAGEEFARSMRQRPTG